MIQGGKLAAQGCLKISACRDCMVGSGLGALLGVGVSVSIPHKICVRENQLLVNSHVLSGIKVFVSLCYYTI